VRALAIAILMSGVAAADKRGFDPATVYRVPLGGAPAEGPADAPVTIVAWSDYACGHCNRVQPTLDALGRLYPGQLRWVYRSLPLDDDYTLPIEAALAAAAQGKFRPMNDRLWAVGGHVDRAGAELLARELGLDVVRFRAALDAHAGKDQIAADVKDATALGITGTPTFFINGRPVHGNVPLKEFTDVVDQELARADKEGVGYDALVAKGQPTADVAAIPRSADSLDESVTYRVGLGLPGHQLGPDDALVTIVTWGDFQCPFCAKMAPVLAHVRQKYGDSVRIIFRHLPMAMHRQAALAAEAGVAAAAQGKFWAFHDQVFAHSGKLSRPELEAYAQAAGLDVAAFRAALDDRRHRDAVAAEAADALALGVDGTPTMFVNGKAVVGSRDDAGLAKVIDAELARVRPVVERGIAARDIYAVLMSEAVGDERADPSRVPDVAAASIALRAGDKARAVEAACRRHDRSRAQQLVGGLTGPPLQHAQRVCHILGIDLS
jgi:protein-disulfide isomerase